MSLARVKSVQRAQKPPGNCERCGKEIQKGDPYRWFKVGFRSRYKRVRCMSAQCTPKNSERESSNIASAYAAQEDAHDAIDVAEALEDVSQALSDCSSNAQEVVGEYESSIESAPMLEDQLRPTIDALEEWVGELECCELPDQDDDTHCEEHDEAEEECEACGARGDAALDDAKQAAREAVDALAV